MAKKKKNASSELYDMARNIGKVASFTRDIEILMSNDPDKIFKRLYNKQIAKMQRKIANKMRLK